VSRAKGIPRQTAGETTWKRPEIERGLQADQCYFFDPVKIAAATAAWARRSNEVADYPNPDLAIEIDLSGPKVDRPEIYAKLKIAEIWRFDGQAVVIEQLQDDGSYVAAAMSRFSPLTPDDILRWLVQEDSGDELDWERRLDAWAKSCAASGQMVADNHLGTPSLSRPRAAEACRGDDSQPVLPNSRRSVPGFNIDNGAALNIVKRHIERGQIDRGKRSRGVHPVNRDDRAWIDDQPVLTPEPHWLVRVADNQQFALKIQEILRKVRRGWLWRLTNSMSERGEPWTITPMVVPWATRKSNGKSRR
jgi:hypothetical protein